MVQPTSAPRVVVMGVSGCGKSTVGAGLAAQLGIDFLEGDQLHSEANVRKMAAGTPLTDADRAGWLAAIGQRLADARNGGRGLVVACSALRRRYRDQLRAAAAPLAFIHLAGAQDVVAARLAGRQGHYMPAALLPSQYAALEPPGADEGDAFELDLTQPPATLVAQAAAALSHTAGAPTPLHRRTP